MAYGITIGVAAGVALGFGVGEIVGATDGVGLGVVVALGAGVGVGVRVGFGVMVAVGVGVRGRQGGAPIGMSPAPPKYTRVIPLAAQRPEASRKIAISVIVPA